MAALRERLAADGHTAEFIKDQYRHGKTLLALGASRSLLAAADIDAKLPDGGNDPGVLLAATGNANGAMASFIEALAMQRHPQRETDPPRI